MSHLKERKEKDCLNCNAVVNGKYCSVCGQENLEPQEPLWHLIVHFFNDITHFDGKFFSSVKFVITKPGFLTAEYERGRRMSYLNPVRFYVFTSFLFFLIFFSFILNTNEFKIKEEQHTGLSKNISDDAGITSSNNGIDSLKKLKKKKQQDTKNRNILGTCKYRDKKEYDSLKLLGQTKETGLGKLLVEKGFEMNEKYGNDNARIQNAYVDNLLHSIPQTLFFTLPLFALALQLLYLRSRKHNYVFHVIFTIHLYIFIYIDFLMIYLFEKLSQIKYLHWLSTVEIILELAIFYYAYKAMRNFYDQGRGKTLLKLFILSFAMIFITVIFAILLFTLSIYKM